MGTPANNKARSQKIQLPQSWAGIEYLYLFTILFLTIFGFLEVTIFPVHTSKNSLVFALLLYRFSFEQFILGEKIRSANFKANFVDEYLCAIL